MKYISEITLIAFFAACITFFAIGMASAEDTKEVYEDGTYDIPMQVFKAKDDKESLMQKYVKEDVASVTIENGEANVSLTFTEADMIKSFLVDNGTEKVEVQVVDENEADDEQTVLFEVANLAEIVDAEITVDVPILPTEMTSEVRLKFDVSELQVVEAVEVGKEDLAETDDDDLTGEDTNEEKRRENPSTINNTLIIVIAIVGLAIGFVFIRKIVRK